MKIFYKHFLKRLKKKWQFRVKYDLFISTNYWVEFSRVSVYFGIQW